MTAANVNLVRSIYAAWRDGTSARPFMDPEIEYVNPPDAIEPGTRRGPETFGHFRDAYENVRIEPHRYIDLGDDVVVLATVHATGRSSGVPIVWEHGYIWTVTAGKARRFRWFNDPAQALDAVGLGDESRGA